MNTKVFCERVCSWGLHEVKFYEDNSWWICKWNAYAKPVCRILLTTAISIFYWLHLNNVFKIWNATYCAENVSSRRNYTWCTWGNFLLVVNMQCWLTTTKLTISTLLIKSVWIEIEIFSPYWSHDPLNKSIYVNTRHNPATASNKCKNYMCWYLCSQCKIRETFWRDERSNFTFVRVTWKVENEQNWKCKAGKDFPMQYLRQ